MLIFRESALDKAKKKTVRHGSKVREGAAYKVQEGILYKVQ